MNAAASQVALVVKSRLAMQKTGDTCNASWIPGLGRSPGGGLATYSSSLAWRIPWTEEPGGWQATVHGISESDTIEVT